MALSWHCHGIAMALPWHCHGNSGISGISRILSISRFLGFLEFPDFEISRISRFPVRFLVPVPLVMVPLVPVLTGAGSQLPVGTAAFLIQSFLRNVFYIFFAIFSRPSP